MHNKVVHILIALMLLFPLSCATATGPLFKEVQSDGHKGKAIVYFYRHSRTGSLSAYDLEINSHVILPLLNKGYHLLVLEPGSYEFKVFDDPKVLKAENDFIFQSDETYFIRYWAEIVGYKHGPIFILAPGGAPAMEAIFSQGITSVPREEALEVLNKCRLIEVTGNP